MARGSVSTEEQQRRALAVATKKPLTAAELAEKMSKKDKNHNYSARGIGRSLAGLVRQGRLVKTDERKSRYHKPA